MQPNVKNIWTPSSPSLALRQRRRLSRGLDILTNLRGQSVILPEECRFLLNTQLMFLKKEKDPTRKLCDDEEWIRSLTEAQEITADIPEESVTMTSKRSTRKRSDPFM